MGISTTFLYLIIALTTILGYYVKRHLSYWKRRGIPHDEPGIFGGSMKGFEKTRHIKTIIKECYDKFKGTGVFAGFYIFLSPAIVVLDLDLVKNILIKDFNNFTDRGVFYNEIDDPLSAHLFSIDGEKWKKIRNKLSPTFTSGKMKFMFPTVVSVGDHLIEEVKKCIRSKPILEVKDIVARFTTDVIGTCAFGLDCNSLNDPNTEFRIEGQKAFVLKRHSKFVEGFMMSFPRLARKLRMRHIHEDTHQFFMRVAKETVDYREKNNIKRNDFMNLLIDAKNTDGGLTINELAAQAFVFFVAGFETSSTTMGFALFELAKNQDIQDKLRAEINEQYEIHDGKLTYEAISAMAYMEKVVKETLRKYSVVTVLFRKPLKDYPTSDPKYTIPKGTMVLIPTDAIHKDPEIYPDPEHFDPDRFSPEEITKRHPITWLPFGDGPRNCIGLRFGKMQAYIGLAMLLRNFKFSFSEKTPQELEIDVTNFVLTAKGGIYLRVECV